MSKYVTHFPEFSVAFSLVLGNVFICLVLDIKASRLMQYVDVCGGITSLVFSKGSRAAGQTADGKKCIALLSRAHALAFLAPLSPFPPLPLGASLALTRTLPSPRVTQGAAGGCVYGSLRAGGRSCPRPLNPSSSQIPRSHHVIYGELAVTLRVCAPLINIFAFYVLKKWFQREREGVEGTYSRYNLFFFFFTDC